MRTTEIRGLCPYCFRALKTATDRFGEAEPESFDIGICKGCGGVLVFDMSKRLNNVRKPRPNEWRTIDHNASYQKLRALYVQERAA